MSYSYVARQEILDINKNTIAYELLFRNGPNNTFPDVDSEFATNTLLSEQFFSSTDNVLGSKLGFIKFPYKSLINKIPTLFPKDKVIVEILEDCPPTDELFDELQSLKSLGYTLVLNNFVPSPEWEKFYPLITIIKLDLTVFSIEESALLIKSLLSSGIDIEFLAQKVETYDQYKASIEVGFTLFQGYFFSKPEMIKQKSITPSFLTRIKLSKIIAQKDIDYGEIEKVLAVDVSLSYKLLRYVNSSSLIRAEIKSFRQALAYLGQEQIRKFISLIVISSDSNNKPESLFSLSIQRARFSELIAQSSDLDTPSAFLTGMFSLLDSLLDQPLDTIVNAIPLDKEIQEALLLNKGKYGNILSLVIAYEHGKWDEVSKFKEILNLDDDCLVDYYKQSLTWADGLFK